MKYETLSKLYKIENNKVFIELSYPNFSDMLDPNILNYPRLSNEFYEKIQDLIKPIPRKYDLEITINIENKEKEIEEVKEIIIENLKFKKEQNKLFSGRKIVFAILMLILGFLFFLLYYFSLKHHWGDMISEIFDIAAWVFIWEAVTLYFIEFQFERLNARNLLKRIKKIEILN